MAVGLPLKTTYANGEVYSASDVNDTNGTINANVNPYVAGKNRIINGDFRFNQRGFTSTTTDATYGFDRFKLLASSGATMSAQTFTPGTAPVSGYEAANFCRIVTTGQSGAGVYTMLEQQIEDVRTFAGQTITISFWAKAASGTPKIATQIYQYFGTGGSPSAVVSTYVGQSTLSTSWARYSLTIANPSISGKTIGTTANTSSFGLRLWVSAGSSSNAETGSLGIQSNTFDMWGIQVEQGSTATAFQTATGTIQGELAACQRYYYLHASVNGDQIGVATYNQTTESLSHVKFPVTMRTAPTLSATTGASFYSVWVSNVNDLINSLTIFGSSINACGLFNATESSGVAGTAGRLQNTSGFVAFVAEL
jgi:hypothetical protein